jgi:hypothetical protein
MDHVVSSPELFPHLRIVMGMVIGLGITRLLTGVAGFIQHPQRAKPYPVHLFWVASLLLELVEFWWWQFKLFDVSDWSFLTFCFIIAYSIILYLIAALLFPDNVTEYNGYEGFFMSRRKWFFSLYASTFVFDLFDSMLKGGEYFSRFGYEYIIEVPVGIALCAIAIWTPNRRYHYWLALLHLIYQVGVIGRLYYTAT